MGNGYWVTGVYDEYWVTGVYDEYRMMGMQCGE